MMGFEYTNSKGIKFYLHRRGGLLFFSKDPTDAIDLPEGLIVIENEKTHLPMVKKA
jgi:hypothetical protein